MFNTHTKQQSLVKKTWKKRTRRDSCEIIRHCKKNLRICSTHQTIQSHAMSAVNSQSLSTALTIISTSQIQNIFLTAHSTQNKSVRLYQCQSKILFIIILGHCLPTYPGRGVLLRHTQVGAYFYDIPRSGRTFMITRIEAQLNDIPGSMQETNRGSQSIHITSPDLCQRPTSDHIATNTFRTTFQPYENRLELLLNRTRKPY